MALKDWKKIGERKGFIQFLKNTNRSRVIIENYPLGWEVKAYISGRSASVFSKFGIKTRSQALKFAKQYMRTH